ncbi:phage tail tape measure protein [Caecibacteroides pullorum]|uniref:Phage tail tape measure protein n=1 Tax=Caecibacteroides pullorum TaxID=2725562 RepID=A0AA40ZRT5_9BACT|nr:phage tail tape measure protein [Caecibacteroides pullorum]MBM6856604.1 phage tail tape measure protein [Caecibacteroides pullorum]MBV8057610.1 phage tail tape measure protein [Caecibacteroides pullorum]
MSLKIDRVQLEIIVQQDSARQKMIELEKDMKNASSTLNKLKKQFGENSAEYKAQEQVVKKLKAEYDKLFEEIGIGKLSLKELGNRQRELNAILRNLDPSLPQWKQYNQQLKEVNARIRELRNEAKETQFSIAKLADGFNRYAAIGASVIASLTGVALTARKCVDEYAQMEEAQSQVIKYTGMTKEETEALNESFKQMDTRTPREELNRLAGEAGKLGISSRDQVLEFVEAADMINVALGEDLGEDAVKNIGKLSQMFGDGSRTLKEDMLAIGSAVNQVAQSSSASEPYLVEFTARMGGVAKQADLAVTDVMGFASALDQNMLRSEMASTALQSLILKIYQEPAKYAKLAGMDVQEFVNLVNTDVNEALLQFLGTLGKMGGMAQMSPILKEMKLSGAEAAGVISALAGNIDQVRREQVNANQAFIDGTSIINEFGVQNNTVQAGLDKAKKQFKDVRVELGEQLLPVMKYMVTTGSLTVKGLKEVVSIMVDYKSEILTAGAAVVTYTLYLKAATLWTNRHTVATKTATVATTLFNKALKMSPWGLALAGVASLISYFAIFKDKTDEATASLGSMNNELDKTKETMDLISKVKLSADNFQFLTDRQKQQMKADAQKGIEELDDLITQGMITNKQWYESEKQSLLKLAGDNEILRKLYMSGLEHDLRERMSVIAGYIEEKKELQKIIGMVPDSNNQTNVTVPTDQKDAEAALKSRYQNELNLLKEKYLNQQLTEEQYNKALYDAEVKYLASRKLLLEQYGQDSSEIQGQIYDKMIAEANRLYEETKTVDANRQTDLLGQAELEYQQEQSRLKQAYLDGDIRTQEDYQERMLEAERSYLEQRRDMLAAFGMDTSAEDGRLLDMDLKDKESGRKKQRKRGFEDIANTTDLDQQLNLLKAMYDADLINYEEYQETKTQLTEAAERQREEITKTSLDVISQATSAASQLIQALQDAEISKIESRYDKQIEAAKAAGKDTTKLEEQKEAAVNEVKRKYADKQFAASVLQVTATTAVTAMEAYKAMAGIPFIGPALGAAAAAAALAAGAAQIAVAKQQRDEAKGLKSGGYSDEYVDGYTRKGNPNDVAGVIPVHKNEFVANHEAVGNPAVKQFLDVFDVAQKKGTIRMLNTTQILEQVRTRSGRYSGGYTYDNPTRPSATISAELGQMTPEQRLQVIALLQENNRLLAVLCNKELVVDPRKVRDGIKRVETLERNVSR